MRGFKRGRVQYFENHLSLCPKLSNPSVCYKGAGKRIGEEFYEAFYDNPENVLKKCGPNNDFRCDEYVVLGATKMLSYNKNKGFEYCEQFVGTYKNRCYEGIGWGLGERLYPEATSNHLHQALDLYELGADYVILPHIIGGKKVSGFLLDVLEGKRDLKEIRNDHLKELLSLDRYL